MAASVIGSGVSSATATAWSWATGAWFSGGSPLTSTGAVGPVGATVKSVDSAPASLVYVPGVDETATPKPRVTSPPAGTLKGPAQRRFSPLTVGSAVVAPVEDPAV